MHRKPLFEAFLASYVCFGHSNFTFSCPQELIKLRIAKPSFLFTAFSFIRNKKELRVNLGSVCGVAKLLNEAPKTKNKARNWPKGSKLKSNLSVETKFGNFPRDLQRLWSFRLNRGVINYSTGLLLKSFLMKFFSRLRTAKLVNPLRVKKWSMRSWSNRNNGE